MNDERLSTAGSFRMMALSCCCLWAIRGNEMDSVASEMPWMMPVSCTGKKPLGT